MQFLESVFVRVVFDFLTVAQTVVIKDSSRVSRNKFSVRTLISIYRELESVHHSRGSRPTSTSTYLIFNQLQIIHPQFRPKSRCSVLEPSQNFLSDFHCALPEDSDNLPPREDLEIFAPLGDFDNLPPRVDLEIFAPLRDFENLSLRADLEIFTRCRIRASINEDLKYKSDIDFEIPQVLPTQVPPLGGCCIWGPTG
ncbi:hypothetical protein HZH68_001825 [Vespula germanica]|uniref:Uncharacterized protein n=1 Tax=Vespula germanica TaxID=30212 RepID=A0A834NWI4_VESGE|nr:hypothetical protein HZH68_001825 [Vespula germanica]